MGEITELFEAAQNGDEARVAHLLQAGADPNARYRDGMTILMLVADTADEGVIRLFLEAGADPNIVTDDGRTALLEALRSWESSLSAIQALIDGGADPTVADKLYGRSPLEWAEVRPKVRRILLEALGLPPDEPKAGSHLELDVRDAQASLEACARDLDFDLESLDAAEMVVLMTHWYESSRFSDVADDSLLFQWGTYRTYNWDGTASFTYELVRLLITADPHGNWHIGLTLRFKPTADTESLVSGSRRCSQPQELSEMKDFIAEAPATAIAREQVAESIELTFEDVY